MPADNLHHLVANHASSIKKWFHYFNRFLADFYAIVRYVSRDDIYNAISSIMACKAENLIGLGKISAS